MRRMWSLVLAARFCPVATAQAPGVPVINAGVAKGVTLGAMVGIPKQAGGKGTAGVLSLSLGAPRIGVTGFVSSRWNPGTAADDYTAVGASLNWKVFGGPLVPVAAQLQIGAAYFAPTPPPGNAFTTGSPGYDDRDRIWHLPVGLGISWTIARPVVALKPWIAPRLDLNHTDPAGGFSGGTSGEFGLSGGLSLGFLNGLSVDLAYDRVFADAVSKPATFGLGLSYRFR